MNTFAQPTPADEQPTVRFTGTLLEHAQVRQKAIDPEGHMVPALCLDIALDCPQRNRLQAIQLFTADQQHACEAAAQRYRKGAHVTVDAPLAALRMLATRTTHIHVHQPEETPAS